jgi:DNA-binding protein HU-beta
MNRVDLIAAVAADDGPFSRALAGVAVDRVFGAITEALKSGDEVRISAFGTFTIAERAASEGRNPRTGEKIQIAGAKLAKFRPGKRLRDELNAG